MKSGQVLIIGIIFVAVASILTISLFSRVADFLHFGSNSILKEQATQLAEAGVDSALWQLNKTPGNCPSGYCGSEQTLGTTGSFIVTVQDKTSSLKTITATGYVPNATNPRVKRTIKVDVLISADTISFYYAVQVGDGGVFMANSSTINGTVYSNGNIEGHNSSKIDGEAWAYGSISSPDPAITHPPSHPNASLQPLPDISDEINNAQIQALAGGVIDCSTTPAECYINSGPRDLGPKKYINGDLNITNNAIVTIKGPVWVTGNLNVSQGETQVNLDESFGSVGSYIIVDGIISISQGATFNPTSAKPNGYLLVVTNSTSPNAMSIGQSGANAVFYTLNGGAELSQTASVNALVAKKLTIQNSAVLNYDAGLASALFTHGQGASWQIKKGTYKFTNSP